MIYDPNPTFMVFVPLINQEIIRYPYTVDKIKVDDPYNNRVEIRCRLNLAEMHDLFAENTRRQFLISSNLLRLTELYALDKQNESNFTASATWS